MKSPFFLQWMPMLKQLFGFYCYFMLNAKCNEGYNLTTQRVRESNKVLISLFLFFFFTTLTWIIQDIDFSLFLELFLSPQKFPRFFSLKLLWKTCVNRISISIKRFFSGGNIFIHFLFFAMVRKFFYARTTTASIVRAREEAKQID